MINTPIRSLEDGQSLTGKTEEWLGQNPDPLPLARTALRFLLAVFSVVFGLLAIAYRMRMGLGDWQVLGEPWQLWLNTAMLFASSVFFERTRRKLRLADTASVKAGLLLAGLTAMLFIAGQLWVWQLLMAQGYYLSANPANSFFYLLTGLHGLHLLGGLIVWLRSYWLISGSASADSARVGIELCCNYWHFLLLVWLLLLALLLGT